MRRPQLKMTPERARDNTYLITGDEDMAEEAYARIHLEIMKQEK